MKNLFWRAVAWIACRPAITDFLIRTAMRRPYVHIGDYMHRYWLIPRSWHLPVSIRIHHILRPDADPYLHDHPWPWRTIVLRGYYIEETSFGGLELRQPGDTRGASAETTHRIDAVSGGGVWTMFFIFGSKKNKWGFYVGDPARKIYYRNYQSPNDRGDLTANDNAPRTAADIERRG